MTPRTAPKKPRSGEAARRTPARRAPGLPAWAALCFLVSGAAGLLYEVVWSKELSHVLGNSLHAISTVVAAFLCGLALGAWRLGPWLSKPGQGARRYAYLELGIAAFGLVSVPLLRALMPAFGGLYHALGGGTAAFAAARFAIVFLVLLPPTLLMGATLPVLVDYFEHDLVGPALARLYAINTAGAVAGSWLGGFVLVPGVGLLAASVFAAALNVVAALAALRLAPPPREGGAAGDAATTPAAPAAARLSPGAIRLVAVGLALSGFAALAFQIAWVRLFGLILGSSVYSFAGVLGVYLTGLAIGSALAGRWIERVRSLAVLASLQAVLALAAALALWFFPQLPDQYLAIAKGIGTNWASLFVAQLSLVAVVVLVPCLAMGAVFPVAVRFLQHGGSAGTVGRAYAVNTAGTIAGSLAAGYLLVPTLGVQGTHVAAVALSAVVAAIAGALAWREGGAAARAGAVATAVAALAVALCFVAPAWDPTLMSAGVFRPTARAYVEGSVRGGTGSVVRRAMAREKVLLYREGLNGSVLVTLDTLGNNVAMRIGGKVDASGSDMLTQALSGLLPGALADSGARALVIGQGSGVTLSALLATGAGRTDLVELEHAVLDGSRFFHEKGHDPLDDPRVNVIVEDGRTVLEHARERWDVIVSEPSNPWLAGVNNLFTRDFYRLVRKRLAPGGVFTQWVQLYEISPTAFGSILGGFLESFPRGEAYLGAGGVDLILVACDSARTFSLARLSSPTARAELARGKLLGPEGIAGYWLGPVDSLRALVGDAPANTDDRPFVEYRAPRDLVERGQLPPGGMLPLVQALPRGKWRDAGTLFAEWGEAAAWFTARARELANAGRWDAALATVADARASGLGALADELAIMVADARRGAELPPLLLAARDAALAGRGNESRALLEQAAQLAPRNGRVWVLLAEQRRQGGDPEGSLDAAAKAMEVGTYEEKSDALICAGLVEVERKQFRVAAERFRDAQRFAPKNELAYAFEAKSLFDGGDRLGAQLALKRGLTAVPGGARLEALRSEIGI
jgi:spermidine synthase